MKNAKLKFKIQNFLAIFILLFFASPVFAAQMFFEAKKTEIGVGEKIEVNLFINSEKESVNAYEAKIFFSGDILNVKEIRDGNSIVIFWIEKPKIEDGKISFSGITPGGFEGEKGLILSIIFEAKKEGVSKFEIKDARVLKNDAMGSEASLSILPFEILVSKEIPPQEILEIEDREPPETFVPEIARDETIFGGKWFLVFSTKDKGSGIDHYEVKEGKRPFVIAESPYLLKNQNLDEEIVVKAVDKKGNERIVVIPPKFPKPWYKKPEIFAILILIAVFLVVSIILWKRRRKQ